MLNDDIKQKLKEEFKVLKDPVLLVLHSKNDDLSKQIKYLLTEISELSSKIDFKEDSNLTCLDYPCINIRLEDKDFGIKYMGLPSGGEFKTFIDTIKMVSTNDYKLSERIEEFVEEIDKPIEIKVFVTTSCGWCPPAILKAYSFALVNDFITATAIDCFAFRDYAMKYNVSAVPKTVINDKIEFVGYKEDNEFFGYIAEAVEETF
jgi:glutaredoxin-like protein